MPTDTTIIDRLREMANGLINGAPECWNGDDARAQVGWAQDMLAAADALTAAHAARDAAQTNLRAVMKRADADLAAALRERDEARAALESAR